MFQMFLSINTCHLVLKRFVTVFTTETTFIIHKKLLHKYEIIKKNKNIKMSLAEEKHLIT